jgi:hypothetical protein
MHHVRVVAVCADRTIVAGNDSGLYRIEPGMPPLRTSPVSPARGMIRSRSGTIVAVLNDSSRPKGYRSTDCGATWTSVPSAGDQIAVSDDGVFYSFGSGRALRSTDDGATWQQIDRKLGALVPLRGDSLFATGFYDEGGSLFHSTDRGTSWTSSPGESVARLARGEDDEVFGLGSQYYRSAGLQRLSGDRLSWTPRREEPVLAMFEAARGEWWISTGASVHRSTDRAVTWTEHAEGLTAMHVSRLGTSDGTTIFAVAGSRADDPFGDVPFGESLFRSMDGGRRWERLFVGIYDWLQVERSFACVLRARSSTEISAIYSFDAGASWDSVSIAADDVAHGGVTALLAPDGSALIAAAWHDASTIDRSTDRGASWTRSSAPLWLYSPQYVGDRLYAGGLDSGTWRLMTSGDNGSTWTFLLDSVELHSMAATSSGDLYVIGMPGGDWDRQQLFRSIDAGTRFELVRELGRTGAWAFKVAPDGSLLLFSADALRRSIDGGLTWISSDASRLGTILFDRGAMHVYGRDARYPTMGIDRTTNLGGTWDRIKTPFPGGAPLSLVINADGEMVAGTDGAGVYRRSPEPSRIAIELTMEAPSIRPNPASGIVEITFACEAARDARVTVCDLLGCVVATPVALRDGAGSAHARLDVRGLAAGLYVVRTGRGSGRILTVHGGK